MRGTAFLYLIATLAALSLAAQTGVPASPPDLPSAVVKLQASDFAGAASIAAAVTRREPKNARAWRVYGMASLRSKSYRAAVQAFKKSLALEPKNAAPLYNIGVAYALAGDKETAFAWLTKAKASRCVDLSGILQDNDLSSLRNDPRLKAMLPSAEDFRNPFVEPVKIIREWDGEGGGDQFGWIARNIGDVNGDGVPDFVTSAPTKDIGGANAGRVYAYSTKTGNLLWKADGHPGDQLGTGIEAAGDTNGDGIPDVVAGAPGGGKAYVYSGKDGRVLLTLTAEDPQDNFGRHVSGVGDVDHDGYADVIIGAPGNNAGGKGAGRAYVYSGKDGHLLLTLSGERAGDGFGSTVAGHTDGDQTLLIAGAPQAGPNHKGRTYVYDSLSSKPKFVIEPDATGVALGQMFVSVIGDVDGDRVPDVYASDWSDNTRGPRTGRIYVHSGRDGRRLLTLSGETAGEGFGTCPATAGDVDHDGHADLVIGAWQYSEAAMSGGRVYLYSGKDGRLLKTYTCRTPGDTLGFDAVGMGDVDGDGTIDFLVTAAWSGIHGYRSGRLFIISSGVK